MTVEQDQTVVATPQSNIKVVEEIALHFYRDGSDKVWRVDFPRMVGFSPAGDDVGRPLQKADKEQGSRETAEKIYRKKVAEKKAEGYVEVPFNDPRWGIASFTFAFAFEGEAGIVTTALINEDFTLAQTGQDVAATFITSHVLPAEWAEVEAALGSPLYGISEKVNGHRTLVAYDPATATLTAYNRKGGAVSSVPEAGLPLIRLNRQFVLDGERLTGEQAGEYVIFDLLEWDGQDVRGWPYSQRIATLEAALALAGLIEHGGATAIHCTTTKHSVGNSSSEAGSGSGAGNSNSPALTLLVAEPDEVKARQVIDTIQQHGAEGIIIRTLAAPYEPGDTRNTRKFKFLSEVDAFVIGVKPGAAAGSVTLGLVRPSDGAVIEIGSVRSGLVDADITYLAGLLAQGQHPVLQVEFLGARTVGTKLVEPKTSLEQLRTDKLARECTVEQFGAAKAEMFERAKVVAGLAKEVKRINFRF